MCYAIKVKVSKICRYRSKKSAYGLSEWVLEAKMDKLCDNAMCNGLHSNNNRTVKFLLYKMHYCKMLH